MKVKIIEQKIRIKTNTQRIGSSDYNDLQNKPKINDVELINNKTLDELNIQPKGDYPDKALTNGEIEELLNNFV